MIFGKILGFVVLSLFIIFLVILPMNLYYTLSVIISLLLYALSAIFSGMPDPEAVSHNLQEADKQRGFLQYFAEDDKRRKDCLSYINSYSMNARLLKNGIKVLTLDALLAYD